jgi:hypothetical protein
MAAHPEITLVHHNVLEDFAQGVARAADALGISDNVLICSKAPIFSSPCSMRFEENPGFPFLLRPGDLLRTLVCDHRHADGRATPESCNPSGSSEATYPLSSATGRIITKETYKDYLKEYRRLRQRRFS